MPNHPARRCTGAALVLLTLLATAACRNAVRTEDGGADGSAEAPFFGITVTPPPDGSEDLTPMAFVVRNGPREISGGAVQCHLERIETSTMRVSDNVEQAEEFTTLAPRAEHAVHCDPLVFLDAASGVNLAEARVTIDLEFEVAQIPDRQFARFTFDASRDRSGRLRWGAADATGGAAATRYQ
jgi:hypothetical protein